MVYGNFYENLKRRILIYFVSHYLTNRSKNKDEDEKFFGKMSSIFEFSISKLGYIEIFTKI